MPEVNLIVEPPAGTAGRATKIDQELLDAMGAAFGTENWIGDGKTHKTSKEAGNAVAAYRRGLASKLGIEEHTIQTTVWGVDAKGNRLTDRKKAGDWRVGLKHDPARVKRVKTQSETAEAPAEVTPQSIAA